MIELKLPNRIIIDGMVIIGYTDNVYLLLCDDLASSLMGNTMATFICACDYYLSRLGGV